MEEYAELCWKRRTGEEMLGEGGDAVPGDGERGRDAAGNSSSCSSSRREVAGSGGPGGWWDAVCLLARGERQKRLFESLLEFRKLNRMIPTFNDCLYIVVDVEEGAGTGEGHKFSLTAFLKDLQEMLTRETGKQLATCKVSLIYASIDDLWMDRHPWGEMFAPCSSPVLPHVQTSTMFDMKLSSMASIAAQGKAGIYFASVSNIFLLEPFAVSSSLQLTDHTIFALCTRRAADEVFLSRGTLMPEEEEEVKEEGSVRPPAVIRCTHYMRSNEREDEGGREGEGVAAGVSGAHVIVASDLYVELDLLSLLAEALEQKSPWSLVDDILAAAFSCSSCMEEENKENLILRALSPNRVLPCLVAASSQVLSLGTRCRGKKLDAGQTCEVLGSFLDSSCSVERCTILNSSLHSVTAHASCRVELSTMMAMAEVQDQTHVVGRSSTVSGVFYNHPSTPFVLPPKVRLMSFPILTGGGAVKFVTAFCGEDDNLQQTPVRKFLNLQAEEICKRDSLLQGKFGQPLNLLQLPLFPLHEEPTTSVLLALYSIHQLLGNEQEASMYAKAISPPLLLQPLDRISLNDALALMSTEQCYVKFAPLPGPCLQSVTFHNLRSCWTFPGEGRPSQVKLPARLIVAGGWTDTPPVCFMYPGGIFNLSCRLEGEDPLEARVEVIGGRELQFCSEDQKSEETFGSWEEMYGSLRVGGHPLSPWRTLGHESCTAVHAAVVAVLFDSGLYRRISSQDGPSSPSPFPRGLRLVTNSLLPKGSGLGGSSILALACVRALKEACALEMSLRQEMDVVLMAEQLLGTGGGWQDQIGCEPGAKFTTRDQEGYHVTRVGMSDEHARLLNSRLLCLGTSMTRVAKTVLVGVVDKFISGDFPIVSILGKQLELNARSMRDKVSRFAACSLQEEEEVEACFRAIGEELGRYREHCEGLQGSTFMPESLRPIFAAMAGDTYGANLMGAGNGGFIVGVVKKGRVKEQLLQACQEVGASHGVSLTLARVEVTS